MPLQFLNKVKYLCRAIPNVEWSGPLFYTVEGSVADPQNFKIILQDILPLDKGSAAYTSYDLDDRFVDYLMADEARLEWNVGHIHSHNVMDVFFSGTDKAELNDNAPAHNYYLSLIVNNWMDFVAKVAFVGKVEKEFGELPIHALNEEGKPYVIQQVPVSIAKEKLFTYDCEIISPAEIIDVNDEFALNVTEILKPKPVKTYTPATTAKPAQHVPFSTAPANTAASAPKVTNAKQGKIVGNMKKKIDDTSLSDRGKIITGLFDKIPVNTFEDLSDTIISPIEKYVAELMKFSTPLEPKEDLEDVLGTLEDMNLDAYQIASTVLNYVTPIYDKYFPDADDDEFISDIDEVISILEDYLVQFPFINVTIESLKSLLTNFEKLNEPV